MREFSCVTQSHPCVHSKYSLLLATAIVLASSVLLHAQSVTTPASVAPSDATRQNLPDVGSSSGFSGADSGLQPSADPSAQTASGPGSSFHPRSTGSTPFKLPRSITKTTPSGIKFQFAVPRLSLAAGERQRGGGEISPLDSSGMQSMGGRGSSMFPSGGDFMHSTDAASEGAFGTPSNAISRSNGSPAGGVGVSVPLKTSMFDVKLSMKDLMGGSFSQSAGQASSAGSGSFGLSGGGGAADFGSAGGLRGPGGGGKGPGARISLGLKF